MIRSIITLGVLAAMVAASSAQACSVPVFRYALVQWRPDSFEVIVFHQGPLSDAQKELAAKV